MFSNALPGVSTRLSDDKTNEEQTSLNEGSIPKIKPEELEAGADEPADDSDSELEENGVTRPQHVTERRRVQNTIFSSWLSQRAEKVTKEEVKAAIQNADDEALSIRSLMSKQESNVIITDPREYQIELFERAKKQNIIAVLDTGSGKTLIAVLLLRYMLDRELEDRGMGRSPRIAFFLVDCVTLVFQQFAVLECNLDQKIERFCGEMRCDLWDKMTWNKYFKENMVIVCTAEVLYQCLMHSFITISQINLLIFDEAHHAKKNHSYARIIKDFYVAELDPLKRPKIFGMTASPVDAKVDVVQAARELENLLHCQIATTADLSLLRMSISRPEESIVDYDPLPSPYITQLCANIKSQFGDIESLNKLFQFATYATSELGEWCADQIWLFGLADEEADKMERKIDRAFQSEKESRPIEQLDAELSRIREAKALVKEHVFLDPSFSGNSISSKVHCLHQYLMKLFERPTGTKCIVFVKRRYTVRVLRELFKRIGSHNMHLGFLIGTRKDDAGDVKVSFRQQVLTLMKFRKGEINCLFATSIAEEGLDIPDCNTVIRFDLYGTLIQYIQSRGRARHSNSRYLHMVERWNHQHLQAVREVNLGEQVMRRFCEALPADRLLHGNDCSLEEVLSKEKHRRTYTDPNTGAKLTYGSSLTVLAHFVGCLPHNSESTTRATYVMGVQDKQYVCEVLLPQNSPIRSATGRPSSKRALAKRSAAFEACLLLRKHGYLDAHLLPTYHKQLPAMRNAHLALNLKSTNAYVMRVKPSFWETGRGSLPGELHMTILSLENPEMTGRPCQPLALLTRNALPKLPSLLLHFQPGKMSQMQWAVIPKSFKPTKDMLSSLTSFTLRIFKDIFNKLYENNEPAMSYWLAPVVADYRGISLDSTCESLIDSHIVNYVHANEEVKWCSDMPNKSLADRFLVDRWDGGRRFYSEEVDPNLKPQDSLPEGCAKHRYMNSILDYTVSLYRKARLEAIWDLKQPVLRARRILHRRNWLDELDDSEKDVRTLAYLCPEPLKISSLPTTVVAMACLFPAILFRLESHLITLEACTMLQLDIKPSLALEAFTKDSDNTEEHRAKQIHFQRGMGKNYERLEFLGDCFLKMSTSISLFALNPDNDEFTSHVNRMLLICNKNLFDVAVKLGLFEFIRSQGFSRRTWYPEGIKLLEGKGYKKTGNEVHKHRLGDKTIADVCEAVIGAALLSYSDNSDMDMAVKAVTAFVSSPDHAVRKWDDYYKLYKKPGYQLAAASAAQLDLAIQAEREHKYHFNYPRLLRSAFTHPSHAYMYENIPCYQRLEFLGDALLDMACVNFLFYRHPDRDPQWLTEHKMAMVSNKFLGALCVKLGFHKHMRSSGSILMYNVQDFVTEITEAERESDGARDYWTSTKDPPKCLPDIVEAYIGAVFVDSEFNYKEVERFFQAHIQWFFEDMSIYDTFANKHPTTYIHNLLTLDFGCTNYRLMASELPSIDGSPLRVIAVLMIHNEIVAEGTASSTKYAKVAASKNALEQLQGLAPFEYRIRYRCDCSDGEEGDGEQAAATMVALDDRVGSAI